jgi:alpha-beta hydrolase superfamily lysophospholipase
MARWFCARGWRVRGHDHTGHGRSGGRRGVLRGERQLVEHARALIEGFAAELDEPPLLLGHSMGGALAAQLVVSEGLRVRGLVLSSPALDTGLGPAQRALAAVLYRLAPSLAIGNGLEPEALSHDPAVVRAYLEDPLVHDRISARLLRWLVSAGEGARSAAAGLSVPTLLMVAGADRLVNPEGSRAFSRAAPEGLLTLRWYDDLFHEIFNEREAQRLAVLADLEQWLARGAA